MSKSLSRNYLYYLRNFDIVLYQSLRGLILDETDNDSIILVLSEMKLFLTDLTKHYRNKNQSEVEYEVKITTETNVIYRYKLFFTNIFSEFSRQNIR